MEDIKDKILIVADDLFSKRGVRDVTIDDICRQMGLSKKTFYQYYPQKEELVNDVVNYHLQNKLDYMQAILRGHPPVAALKISLNEVGNKKLMKNDKRIMRELKKYYPDTLQKYSKMREKVVRKTLDEYLNKGMEEGYFRKDLDFNAFLVVLYLTHKGITEYLDDEKVSGRKISGKAFNKVFIDIIKRMLLTEQGWEEYNSIQL